jgi:hypothetical protein
MKLVTKLVFATSLALGLTTIGAKSVSAALVNYAFTVDSPINTGKGFFSFDDSTFSNDSTPEAIVKSLSLQFDGESTVYTEQDDLNYPDFPIAFSTAYLTGDASSIGLDYTFDNKANPSSFRSYEIVGEDFTIFSRTSPNSEIFSGKVSYRQVPEPTTLGGTIFACGLGWILKRKAASMRKVKV